MADDRNQTDEDEDLEYYDTDEGTYMDVDDDEEEEDLVATLLGHPEPQKDVKTMQLRPDERQWALDLKQAIHDLGDLNNLNDMEYAHYAIICQGNIADAIKRITTIQSFRDRYKVDNSVEQAMYYIGEIMKQQKGFFLGLGMDNVTLEGMLFTDMGALNPQTAMEPCTTNGVDYNWRIFVCGFYYFNLACLPVLGSVRAGIYSEVDWANFGWGHLNMEFHQRFAGEMHASYPKKYSKVLCFNTGLTANLLVSLVRHIYPQAPMLKRFRLGCKVPLESDEEVAMTLSQKYLRPTVEQACDRIMARAKLHLTLRLKNEALFRL